ncbi:MAG: bifunctional riboflavin kinase/FAD synthetase [Planctomycetia bacterium]|nr:bifunctional riboflavin kinase/FAD synthetase [Planctomycetia bacterium]
MQVFRGIDELASCRNGYVSIGNFDGVHRAHQSMIGVLTRLAAQEPAPAVIFTFDPHPIALLRPGQSPPPLTTTERKLELLDKAGVDAAVVYPTDQALLNLSPREFFDRIVLQALNVRGLVEGPNFFFGHDRAGNIDMLREFCAGAGRQLEIVPPVTVGDHLVSSTEIRRLIADGRVREAGELLGYAYRVSGTVVRGAERGRTIGFPTANLEGIRTVLPRDGVYAARVRVGEQWYAAGVNLGPSPTFVDQERKFEAHLDGYAGDLYGSRLIVELVDRLRDTVRFDGVESLKQQLVIDLERARAVVSLANPTGRR